LLKFATAKVQLS